MRHWGITQSDIAVRLDISQGTVSGWFNRHSQPQPRTLAGLAKIFDVTPEWLITGKEPKLSEAARRRGEQAVSTLPATPPLALTAAYPSLPVLDVPLISSAQAGIATDFEELPEAWQEKIPLPVSDKSAFAIRICGDSMEPKYANGDIAVVLPNVAARHGDLVVVSIKGDGIAFKILNLVDGDPRRVKLSSFNPLFAPQEYSREDFHWIHPVQSVATILRR